MIDTTPGNKKPDPDDSQDPHLQSPSVQDEESVSGSSPSTDSDDDVTQMNQDVGLALDEKEGFPQEVSLADDFDKAERLHRDE